MREGVVSLRAKGRLEWLLCPGALKIVEKRPDL